MGIFFGSMILMYAFILVISTIIKVPGGKAVQLWVVASLIQLLALFTAGYVRNNNNFFLNVLLFSAYIFGFFLTIWGAEIFALRKPNIKSGAKIIALFQIPYALFLLTEPGFELRSLCFTASGLLLWPMVARGFYRNMQQKYALPKAILTLSAVVLWLGCALRLSVRLYFYFQLGTREFDISNIPYGALASFFALTMLGAMAFSFGVALLFFERVLEHTEHMASHDELTGLLNRRALILAGEREIALARRRNEPIAVAFMDIDFFKKINDTYGHDKGDLVLREVSAVLSQTVRAGDVIGRYGGEEFCVIFPNENHAGVQIIGQRLITAVREHHFEGVPGVTISAGLAVLQTDQLEKNWHTLLAEADGELYKAKHTGRNRYCIQDAALSDVAAPGSNVIPLSGMAVPAA